MEESIYNLIPPAEAKKEKAPRYKSKFRGDSAPTYSTFSRSGANVVSAGGDRLGHTFGRSNDHTSDPRRFVKKQTRDLPPASDFSYGADRRKPAVPKRNEGPTLQHRNKNFIAENTLSAITAVPKKGPQEPTRYVARTDYGKVPAYLSNVKQQIQEEQEYIERAMTEQMNEHRSQEPQLTLLPEEERLRLLGNLKKKWDVINEQYQAMTHMVVLDTTGKVRRKEQYESQLAQLEKSIEKLSRPNVYVQQ